jgi:hypothetical protein
MEDPGRAQHAQGGRPVPGGISPTVTMLTEQPWAILAVSDRAGGGAKSRDELAEEAEAHATP